MWSTRPCSEGDESNVGSKVSGVAHGRLTSILDRRVFPVNKSDSFDALIAVITAYFLQGRNHGFKVGGSNLPFPSPFLPALPPLQGA